MEFLNSIGIRLPAAASTCIAAILIPALPHLHASSKAAPVVRLHRLPDGAVQPSVAIDGRGVVHVTYFTGELAHGDVFYSRIDASGTLASPVKVNTMPASAIAVGSVRGQRLAVANGRIHVVWMGSDRARQDNGVPMFYTRSRPDGTFEPERNLHREEGPLDGGSVAADNAGNVYVAWHALLPGEESEAGRRAWVARSNDAGATFGRETAASPEIEGACGCCGTASLVDSRGDLFLFYRGARESTHRNSILLASTDRGSSFKASRMQEWTVGTCPMSTFSLADSTDGVVAAWETAGQVYWTTIAGTEPSAPIAPPGDARTRRYPSIARNARGETLLAWTEGMGFTKPGTLVWQVFDRSGAPVGSAGRGGTVPVGSLVAAYAAPDGAFAIVY